MASGSEREASRHFVHVVGVRANPSVEARPNSYACKPYLGQNHHRPRQGLHAPLQGSPHLER
jgi:hypothetical protein